jgi:uncharacterized small protein (DUF1192 family)
MDIDELEPARKTVPQKILDPLSIGELEDYIASLRNEIARAEAAITAKRAVRSVADSIFKK